MESVLFSSIKSTYFLTGTITKTTISKLLAKNLISKTEYDFPYFKSSLKKYAKYVLLSVQLNCSYFYLIMIKGCIQPRKDAK